VSDEPQHTYSAREIILEFFPATHSWLVPKASAYRLEPDETGQLLIYGEAEKPLLSLIPIASAGNASTQLCCDLCQHSAPRHYLRFLRAEIPGPQGRRFCYVTVCRNLDNCELRRLDDRAIIALLARVGL
jgi:hypothetical protein